MFVNCLSFIAPITCNESGKIIKSGQKVITVVGEHIQFKCLVQGNLHTLDGSLTSYWEIDFSLSQHRDSVLISDNSTDPYRIAVYQSLTCNFISQLTILSVPLELNGITEFTYIQYLPVTGKDPATQKSTTMLSKLSLHVCMCNLYYCVCNALC